MPSPDRDAADLAPNTAGNNPPGHEITLRDNPPPLTRRALLRWAVRATAATITAGAVGWTYAWGFERHWLRVRHLTRPVRGLPESLDGFRLAQLSDLHHSRTTSRETIQAAVAAANAAAPDAIALTGDYITAGREWVEGVAETLADLAAPAGVWAVLGNHDYQGRRPAVPQVATSQNTPSPHRNTPFDNTPDDTLAQAVTEALSRGHKGRHIRVLRDALDTLAPARDAGSGLMILGLEDRWARRGRLPAVLNDWRSQSPTVALVHNPDDAHDLAGLSDGGPDVVLAGHTHGGQVCLPLVGPPYLPVRDRRLVYGEFSFGSRCWLYVNPGIGCYGWPVRFNARPEVTVLTLRSV